MMSISSSSDLAALLGPTDGVPGADEALEGAAQGRSCWATDVISASDPADAVFSSAGVKSCAGRSLIHTITAEISAT